MNTNEEQTIFIIDDEPQVLASMRRCLRNFESQVHCFESPIRAIEASAELAPDIVISDQRMPFMSGTEMLSEIKKQNDKCTAILVSAFNDFNEVADAFNEGIIQKYLSKPWDNNELRLIIKNALNELKEKKVSPVSSVEPTEIGFHGIITDSPAMKKAFEYISKASKANIPVFISGETGTGKELAAKAFYQEGMRKNSEFVAVNCANFSETLMESQLFGHVKGAFTGAVKNQKGLIESAGDGVLFLDEITCLPMPLQAKLLRVLQEREFSPLGSNSIKKFHAQVVSASSTPLKVAVDKGDFREDLYYRLNVISVDLPPLKDRGDDVLLLANHFLRKFEKLLNKNITGFSESAKNKLKGYNWPGNIRQLENIIHSLVVLNEDDYISDEDIDIDVDCSSFISIHSVPDSDAYGANEVVTSSVEEFVQSVSIEPLWKSEKNAIESAIKVYNGNIPQAAAALEVSPSTLYRKLQGWKKLTI